MEIYKDKKVCDIGINLLTNPNKKKKNFFKKKSINNSTENNTKNDDYSELNEELINIFREFVYNKKCSICDNESINSLMTSLIDTQFKILKFKNLFYSIDSLIDNSD